MTEPNTKSRRPRWPHVLALLAGLLFVLVFLFMRDDKRGDHSDLAPVRGEPTAASEAAYHAWSAACAKMDREVLNDATTHDPLFFERLYGSEPWSPVQVEKILAANRVALDEAATAAALGHFSLPPYLRFDQGLPHLGELQAMAKLLRIYATERQVADAYSEAGDTVRMAMRFGNNIAAESNTLIEYLVGVTCQAIAHAGAERMIVAETPDPELMRLDALLKEEPDLHAALAEAHRREFTIFVNTIEQIEEVDPNVMGPKGSRLPMFLLKENRTINKRSESARFAVSNALLPPKQRTEPTLKKPQWFSSNAVGERLLSSDFAGSTINEKADLYLAQRRLLRLKIALVRHQRDKGALPARLAELVPSYIDAIPADPYDGAPIRYDLVRGAVWVLGKDLTDGGGSPASGKRGFGFKDADPTTFVIHATAAP